MSRFLRCGLLLALMSTAIGCTGSDNPEKYEKEFFVPAWAEGTWQYNSSEGKKIEVTLYNDGSALGSDDSIGSWYSVEDRVYITWMNGWTDMLKQKGGGYEKLGFAPGVAVDATPTNTSAADKIKK